MHELSLSQSLIEIVADHARRYELERVTEVLVDVGALSCVSPHALSFCFDATARGTVAEGATLTISVVEVEAWCWTCGKSVTVTDRAGSCPECGGFTVRATDHGDLKVREIVGKVRHEGAA